MTRQELCNDKTLLVSYVYAECSEAERRSVDQHLADCAGCAAEVTEMQLVRRSLAEWEMPVTLAWESPVNRIKPEREAPVPMAPSRRWTPPWWLQTAAVVLLLAGAAGVAQIEVRYGSDGLVIRTGWSRADSSGASSAAAQSPASASAAQAAAPWRAELAALERELRRELSSLPSATAAARRSSQESGASLNEAVLLRRVQALIEQSEQRQQRELAVRLADVVRDVEIQRRADQLRVQQTFGQLEGQTGVAVRQNRQLLDYLVRVSQQR